MGSNVPDRPASDQISWFENRIPLWQASPAAFGVTAPQLTALQTLITNARTMHNNAIEARASSKAATTSADTALASMLTSGRATVNIMKAFIENSHNMSLWGQAGLEPPATTHGPSPVPTAPFALAATLDTMGSLILTWKAKQPGGAAGVVYFVSRSIDGGSYVLLDTIGGKTFTDSTVPVGAASVAYAIQAKRGDQASPWSEALTVRFGSVSGAGGGGGIVSSTSGDMAIAPKLAA